MASKLELEARAHRQAVVAKVVWGLLCMIMGVLFMLDNLGQIDLYQTGKYPASNAVDGNPETRWSSAFKSPQWITIDFGAPAEITRVRLNWESAYAKTYAIEVSDDGSVWSTVKTVTKSASGPDEHEITANGRYLRVSGTKRATAYGYSLYELEVYGPAGLISQGRPASASSLEGTGPWTLFWPVLMIGAGLPSLLAPKDGGDQVMGLLLTGFGVFFQLQRLAMISWTFAQTWPILVTAAGLLLVAQALRQMAKKGGDPPDRMVRGERASLSGPKGRLALGMLLILFGLLLTLEQAGILNVDGIGRFWPLLLIGIGYVKVRQPLEDGQRAVGMALLAGGGFFQLISVLSWGRAWPLALVFAGGLLLWQAVERPPAPAPEPAAPQSPYVSELALMGGLKRSLRVPDLRGGYITAVMGGVDLDLRKSGVLGPTITLDVVAFWGGIELKVPAEWTVEGRVVPIMGGFEDKTRPLVASDQAPRVVVRGYAIMGAVVIGN